MSDGCPPQPEVEIHSFILKLWLEPDGWGGHITHVPTHVRRSVRHLSEITAFITAQLTAGELDRRGDRRGGDGA
jgi:hypothetical protein